MARGAGRPPPARAELFEIGCVPYKSGKMWAPLMDRFGTYYRTLRMLKAELRSEVVVLSGQPLALSRRYGPDICRSAEL